ncbi:alpha/beta fold hydrolase, partial [Pseudomonas lactis]|uniref:alpha/beta fold hydrolase n=1 Tax=Pseudomonas lactis TaxID=1615674 RepID=UPI0039B02D4B
RANPPGGNGNRGLNKPSQAPKDSLYTANQKAGTRLKEMAEFTMPILITTGQHDELTPACAMRMKLAALHAELHVFPNSSHMPFYEEPQAYFPVLLDFLARHRG